MLTVSLVVPILNAARTLPATLEALRRLRPAPLEMLLVDNGSRDESLELLAAFAAGSSGDGIRLLREPHPGAAAARNAGIRAARGEIVAFTDADCAPDAAWLDHLLAPFADPAVGAVAGRVVGVPAGSLLERFGALYTLRTPDAPARYTRWTPWSGGFPTANLAVRRSLLEAVGGFDESLSRTGEDYDLCAALYARQAAIAYTPAARVTHLHRATLRGLVRQAYGYGRVHPVLFRRHASRGLWIELPGRAVHWSGVPGRCWIDLAAPEKKLLAILAAGIGYTPLLWLAPCYGAWIAVTVHRHARRVGVPLSGRESLEAASLLLIKSTALTAGRWWGSIRHGACCL